jgi:predicted acetyltransferase/DNA-binding MarR family transcriptional regulator
MKSEPDPQTDIPTSAYEVLGMFRSTILKYDRISAAHIRAGGLTPQQYALLVMIAGRFPTAPSVGEAALALMLSHNSAVELAQRAEKAGLLIRSGDPDNRNRTVLAPTAIGIDRLSEVTRRLINDLGPERLEIQTSLDRWHTLLASGQLRDSYQPSTALQVNDPIGHDLQPAAVIDRPLTWNLLQLHLHTLSVYHRVEVDSDGHYPYPRFGRYFRGGGDQAWLVRVAGRPAGFVLFNHRRSSSRYELPEIHLLQAHQGRGLGRTVVTELFRTRPGTWTVTFHEENLAARYFWTSVLRDLSTILVSDVPAALPIGRGRQLEFMVPEGGSALLNTGSSRNSLSSAQR